MYSETINGISYQTDDAKNETMNVPLQIESFPFTQVSTLSYWQHDEEGAEERKQADKGYKERSLSRKEWTDQESDEQTRCSERMYRGHDETLEHYAQKIINNAKGGTAYNYKTALRSLTAYNKDRPPIMHEITYNFIDGYNKWLKKRGVTLNTISCYMRSLRSLYNSVIRQKRLHDKKPFRHISTRNHSTRKRSISNSEIRKIVALKLENKPSLEMTRDLFLFSFYAMGMPFVDMAHLEHGNIQGNYITYYRHKTGQMVCVRIENCMKKIIEKYSAYNRQRIFPIIERDMNEDYRTYHDCLCKYNKLLKRLGKMAGLTENLTSYVARHTWADIAYRMSSDLQTVSTALGHTNTKTTRIYVHDFVNPKLYKINHKILKAVNKDGEL